MSPTHRRALAVLLAVVLLGGCLAVPPSEPTPTAVATPPADFADPDSDVIGWELGIWYSEPITVDQGDGLDARELDQLLARSMARVEYLRTAEFTAPVGTRVITRAEYAAERDERPREDGPRGYDRWNDQVWEALFIIGEDARSAATIGDTTAGAVAGYYDPETATITIVTDRADRTVIDPETLIHELVHALQDQRIGLDAPRFAGQTQDEQLAIAGIIEGEAGYITQRYREQCAGGWDCVAAPPAGARTAGGGASNDGVFITVFQPYSDGPAYVHRLVSRAGWAAVDDAFAAPPRSAATILDADATVETVRPADRSAAGWSRFDHGRDGADVVGPVSLYAMLWYQARTAGADTIDPDTLRSDLTNRYDTYGYESAITAGYRGDAVVPYVSAEQPVPRYGYVFETRWATPADADRFAAAMRAIIRAHDGTALGDDTYLIASGPFADAFRIDTDGRTVRVVNGPTPAALAAIDAPR